jgi:hypothetical protein
LPTGFLGQVDDSTAPPRISIVSNISGVHTSYINYVWVSLILKATDKTPSVFIADYVVPHTLFSDFLLGIGSAPPRPYASNTIDDPLSYLNFEG